MFTFTSANRCILRLIFANLSANCKLTAITKTSQNCTIINHCEYNISKHIPRTDDNFKYVNMCWNKICRNISNVIKPFLTGSYNILKWTSMQETEKYNLLQKLKLLLKIFLTCLKNEENHWYYMNSLVNSSWRLRWERKCIHFAPFCHNFVPLHGQAKK